MVDPGKPRRAGRHMSDNVVNDFANAAGAYLALPLAPDLTTQLPATSLASPVPAAPPGPAAAAAVAAAAAAAADGENVADQWQRMQLHCCLLHSPQQGLQQWQLPVQSRHPWNLPLRLHPTLQEIPKAAVTQLTSKPGFEIPYPVSAQFF